MIININGKRYRWRPEKMNGALLIGGGLAAVIAAAFGLYCAACLLATLGGPRC